MGGGRRCIGRGEVGDSAGAFEWGLISARRTFLTFLRLGILR
jgi:hypothetical protein